MSETAFCGSCGTQIGADARFCPSCGSNQDDFQTKASSPSPDAAPTPRPEPAVPSAEPLQPQSPQSPQSPPPSQSPEPPTETLHSPSPTGSGGPPAKPQPGSPEAETQVSSQPAAQPPEPAQQQPRPQQAPPARDPQPLGGAPAGGPPPPPTQPGAGTSHAGQQGSPGGGRAEQFAQRADALDPNASAFAGQLAAGFRTPGVLVALIGGALAALGCFVFGLILAIAFPDDADESFIGAIGEDEGLITEAFAQTVGLLLVKFATVGDETARIAPMLFVLVPVAACAAGAFSQAGRLRGLAPQWRLASGAAVGVPFGLLMLLAAVATGDLDASVGSALLLGLIWGAIGGALGVSLAVRREAPQAGHGQGPPQVQLALRLLSATLKPLAALLVIAALIGTAAWWIGSFKDHDSARVGRSLPVSLIENTLYAGEHGVNYAALGAGTQFTWDTGFDTFVVPPIPVDNAEDEIKEEFRLFDFSDAMAAYFFVPLLIVLIALPLLLALYAGFAAARAAGARRPELAAAWGALVGPVWAISLALLSAMHVKVVGQPDGESLFGIYLLGGAILGAIGGLLSSQAAQPGVDGHAQHG